MKLFKLILVVLHLFFMPKNKSFWLQNLPCFTQKTFIFMKL